MTSPYVYAGFKNFSLSNHGIPLEEQQEVAIHIIEKICNKYKVDVKKVRGKGRMQPYVTIRQIAMYFIRKNTGMSLKRIGDIFSWRDHTSVIHSIRVVEDQLSSKIDNSIKSDVNMLKVLL